MMDALLCFCLPLAGLALDALLGEPPAHRHPVVAMGRLADTLEHHLRARAARHGGGPIPLFIAGLAGTLLVCACFAVPAAIVAAFADQVNPLAGFAVAATCLWLCIAARSLAEHAWAVLRPLAANDLPRARLMLARIVGRETDSLDGHAVTRACIESVGENAVDGVTASLFWAVAGWTLGGAPLACVLCVSARCVNTLDAMWGRKNERYLYFGRAAARLDDAANWLPARLSLLCISLSALFPPGCNAREALRMGWTYRRAHDSPNSAWSEAAFAGALDLRLAGPDRYAGRPRNHPWIGTGTPDARPEHVALAIRLMQTSSIVTAVLLGAVSGLIIVMSS